VISFVLGAFAKRLRKATVILSRSSIGMPLDGLSWNFVLGNIY